LSSRGRITHLRAASPSGRIVEHPDGTLTFGWEDEARPGMRGWAAITSDGHGAHAVRATLREARVVVCDRLGLDVTYFEGSASTSGG
jgi:hypothetical protein